MEAVTPILDFYFRREGLWLGTVASSPPSAKTACNELQSLGGGGFNVWSGIPQVQPLKARRHPLPLPLTNTRRNLIVFLKEFQERVHFSSQDVNGNKTLL